MSVDVTETVNQVVVTPATTNSVTAAAPGPQGPQGVVGATGATGPAGADGRSHATYVHSQQVASNTWTITHNLDCFPPVQVVDSAGNEVIGDVDYISNNQLVLTFTSAFAGVAYLN